MNTVINNIANGETVGYKQDRASVRGFYEQLVSRMSPKEATADRPAARRARHRHWSLGTDGGLRAGRAPDHRACAGRGSPGTGLYRGADAAGRAVHTRWEPRGRLPRSADRFLPAALFSGRTARSRSQRPARRSATLPSTRPGACSARRNKGLSKSDSFGSSKYPATHLRKDGANYFEAMNAGAVRNSQQTTVVPGTLEGANVGKEQNSIEMMDVIRSYGSVQEMLRLQDQVIGQTVSEVGRVGQ